MNRKITDDLYAELLKAIMNKEVTLFKNLVESVGYLSTSDGQDLLDKCFLIASSKSLPIVDYLLTSSTLNIHANVHIQGDFALRKAISSHRLDIVQFLTTSEKLKEKISLNNITTFNSPLISACSNGNVDIVKFLTTSPLVKDKPDINVPLSNGENALTAACRKGNIEIVRFLLTDPSLDNLKPVWRDNRKALPLLASCHTGSIHILEYLTSSPELKERWVLDSHKEKCAYVACANGSLSVLKFIAKNTEGLQLNYSKNDSSLFLQAMIRLEDEENEALDIIKYLLFDLNFEPSQEDIVYLKGNNGIFYKSKEVLDMIEKRDSFLKLNSRLHNQNLIKTKKNKV